MNQSTAISIKVSRPKADSTFWKTKRYLLVKLENSVAKGSAFRGGKRESRIFGGNSCALRYGKTPTFLEKSESNIFKLQAPNRLRRLLVQKKQIPNPTAFSIQTFHLLRYSLTLWFRTPYLPSKAGSFPASRVGARER